MDLFSDLYRLRIGNSLVNPLDISYWDRVGEHDAFLYSMTSMIDLYFSSKETFVYWDFPHSLSRKLLFPYWSIDLCCFFET